MLRKGTMVVQGQVSNGQVFNGQVSFGQVVGKQRQPFGWEGNDPQRLGRPLSACHCPRCGWEPPANTGLQEAKAKCCWGCGGSLKPPVAALKSAPDS
jgi:hypothetical protein